MVQTSASKCLTSATRSLFWSDRRNWAKSHPARQLVTIQHSWRGQGRKLSLILNFPDLPPPTPPVSHHLPDVRKNTLGAKTELPLEKLHLSHCKKNHSLSNIRWPVILTYQEMVFLYLLTKVVLILGDPFPLQILTINHLWSRRSGGYHTFYLPGLNELSIFTTYNEQFSRIKNIRFVHLDIYLNQIPKSQTILILAYRRCGREGDQ